MEFQTIKYKIENGTAEIRLNRPDRLNAVIEQLYLDLLEALKQAESDGTVRVIILTGEGRAFCVGADLKAHKGQKRTLLQKEQYLNLASDVCKKIYTLDKPVIGAINGYALGAGAEMAVSCDFVFMKKSAQIGFPEISIGTFLGGGVTNILPRIIGLSKSRELIFSGRKIGGEEAEQIGLAMICCEDDQFEEKVSEFAQQLAKKAPISMRFAKKAFNTTESTTLDEAIGFENESILSCMQTKDWQEGIDAFAEKRTPNFTGE